MKRFVIDELIEWKNNPNKKPLILNGARQVGKTWLMLELGKKYYKDYIYLNFDKEPNYAELFQQDLDPKRIIDKLCQITKKKITKDTLIIFDEIQEIPRALTSLKYFNEDAPEYSVICAGSLLGIALHKGDSFPVGKVEHINIYPMTFKEFLIATNREVYYNAIINQDWTIIKILKDGFIEALREYYLVGGMPECVQEFVNNKNFYNIKNIQDNILFNYDKDFSKHTPADLTEKIRAVWKSIPTQLAKENKKFIFGHIREGAKSKEYESAINWLCDTGLVHKVYRVSTPKVPLKFYEDLKVFKLYLSDVGLLCRLSEIDIEDVLLGNKLFVEFKGALTEQYVCEEFSAIKDFKYDYYTNENSKCEIDFIAKIGKGIIPIEVKAEINLQAKSLMSYSKKHCPEKLCRTSMADFKITDNLYDIPLYCISEIREILK